MQKLVCSQYIAVDKKKDFLPWNSSFISIQEYIAIGSFLKS